MLQKIKSYLSMITLEQAYNLAKKGYKLNITKNNLDNREVIISKED